MKQVKERQQNNEINIHKHNGQLKWSDSVMPDFLQFNICGSLYFCVTDYYYSEAYSFTLETSGQRHSTPHFVEYMIIIPT